MTMLYPNRCYNEVCYKDTALYMYIYIDIEDLFRAIVWQTYEK